MLGSSGERVVPDEQREELVYAEHLARYRFAAQFAAGNRVLDAGCGEGYGTALLQSAGASAVVGLDVSEEVVEHARDRYGLEFLQGDIGTLPFADSAFDLVVCFETIEHVSDGPRALAEFRRVLAEDGLLVISTPNAGEYLAKNEFHVREYSPGEFDELLAAQFEQRLWLYQQNWLLSAVLDQQGLGAGEDTALDLEVRKTTPLEPGRELYDVVVCGPLRVVPGQAAVASGIYEANRMVSDIYAWQERAELAERQRAEWEKRATIAEQVREETERLLGETQEHLRRAEDALEKLVSSLSWRITKPLRRARALVAPRR